MANEDVKRLARELNALKRRVNGLQAPQLSHSSIENGAIEEYDEDGNLVGIIGKLPDGTHGVVSLNGPVPPVPTAPVVEGGKGIMQVAWDGKFATGVVTPMDFSRVEVHVSSTPGFTPDPLPDSATRAATIEAPGGASVAVVRPHGTYYVQLVSRATTGKYSAGSAEVSVVVDAIIGVEEMAELQDDIDAVNADLANAQVTLTNVMADLTTATGELADLQNTLDTALGDVMDDVNAAMAAVDTRLDAAETALTTAQGTITTLNDNLATLNTTLAGIDDRVEVTEEDLAEALADIAAAQTALTNLNTALADANSDLSLVQTEMNNLEAEISQAQADITTLNTNLAGVDSRVDDVETDMAALDTTLGGVQTALGNAQGELSTLQTNLGALTGRVGVTESSITTINTNIGTLNSTLSGLATDLSGLEGDLEDLNDDLSALDGRVGTAEGTIGSLNTTLGTVQTDLATTNTNLTQKIRRSTALPGTTANNVGDLWIRENASKEIIGMWVGLGGTSWNAQTLTDAVITNLNAATITAGTLAADRIGANTITATKIASGSIQTAHIVSGAIDADKIAANAVTAAKITAGAVGTNQLAANAVTAANIVAGAISTDKIAANAVVADKIAGNAVTAAKIAAGAVEADKIAANAVTATKILAGSIGTGHLVALSITGDKIAANAITAGKVAAGAIETDKLAANAVVADKIAGNAITAAKIAAGAVEADKIAVNAVTADKIVANAVTTAKIAAGAVTATEIAADAVTASKILAGSIGTNQLAANAVTAEKITAGAVTIGHIKAGDVATPAQLTTAINNATAAANAAIDKATNLVDNPSRSGGVGRWYGSAGTLSVVDRLVDGKTIPVLQLDSTGNGVIYSANGTNDFFAIDPTKAYQISLWVEDEKAATSTQFYFGIHVHRGGTNLAITPVSASTGVASAASSNVYFFSATASGAPIGGFQRYVAYLMPHGTDPASMKGLGINVNTNAILPADATIGRIRVLNYNNAGVSRKMWIANPTVTEVDPVAVAAIAAERARVDNWTHSSDVTRIDGGKIFTDSITSNQIAANAITASEIAANAVTAAKILAGSIETDKIAANAITAAKIAANTITASEIAANAITADELAANSVLATNIAANAVTAEKILAGAVQTDKLAANAVTADKITANAVTADKIATNAVTADKIVANAISADKIATNAVTADKILAGSITAVKIATDAVTADKIQANAITTAKILAGAITVDKLETNVMKADNIKTGVLNAEIGIASNGLILAGNTNQWAQMDSQGFRAMKAVTEDTATEIREIASLGSGKNYLMFMDTSGNPLGGFSDEGLLSSVDLDVSNTATFNGRVDFNAEPFDAAPGNLGPFIQDKHLIDRSLVAHFQAHPGLGEANGWTLGLAYGIVGHWRRSFGSAGTPTPNSNVYRRELVRATFEAQPNRVYRVHFSAGPIARDGGTNTRHDWGKIRMRSSSSPGSGVAWDTGTLQTSADLFLRGNNGNEWTSPQAYVYLIGGVDIPAGTVNLLTYIELFAQVGISWGSSAYCEIVVEDVGRWSSNFVGGNPTGIHHGSQSGGGSGGGSVAKEYTKTYTSNNTEVWALVGGSNQQVTSSTYHKNRLRSGRGGSSNYHSYAFFPDMTGDLSGATITNIQMYVYYEGDYPSGSAPVGIHNHALTTTGGLPSRTHIADHTFQMGQGKWITIPNAYWAGFKSGTYRGITVGSTASGTIMNFHSHYSGNKPKIRVTYRK
jgi:predicted  nucleic acid-binding Zn-ribbon protein